MGNSTKYIKAFIAGITLPSLLLPLLLSIAWFLGKFQILNIFFLHFIPIIWGIWNVLYFAFFQEILPKNLNVRLLITGAVLGLIIASYGVFWLNIPAVVGLPPSLHYLPLVVVPILYAVLWLYAVKPLNDLLNLTDR